MDRFVRRIAPKLAADSAPQPVEVAAAAATQRGARPEAVANPDAHAADEVPTYEKACCIEKEYDQIPALLSELPKEQTGLDELQNGQVNMVSPSSKHPRHDTTVSKLQPAISPAAADVQLHGEAQGRGCIHGHAKLWISIASPFDDCHKSHSAASELSA